MQTSGIIDVQELKRNLLKISIDFFNIDKLSECLFFDEKCDGCHGLAITKQDTLIKKACRIVSRAISILTSVSETLLFSDCITKEEKIILAGEIRILAYDIKVFLFTHSHILSSRHADKRVKCDCDNHNNIKILSGVFMSIIDIK